VQLNACHIAMAAVGDPLASSTAATAGLHLLAAPVTTHNLLAALAGAAAGWTAAYVCATARGCCDRIVLFTAAGYHPLC
jgi:hypothetical protein